MSENPVVRPPVVPAAILTFTQSDANQVAAMCPCDASEQDENVLYVHPLALDEKMVKEQMAKLVCSHYAKDKKTGESKVKAEWAIDVPIMRTVHKNVFAVNLPAVASNILDFKK